MLAVILAADAGGNAYTVAWDDGDVRVEASHDLAISEKRDSMISVRYHYEKRKTVSLIHTDLDLQIILIFDHFS